MTLSAEQGHKEKRAPPELPLLYIIPLFLDDGSSIVIIANDIIHPTIEFHLVLLVVR